MPKDEPASAIVVATEVKMRPNWGLDAILVMLFPPGELEQLRALLNG